VDRISFIFAFVQAILQSGEGIMRPLDVPEVLIILGLLGSIGLAVYNWNHRKADARKHR
jgi:hypothetical protein